MPIPKGMYRGRFAPSPTGPLHFGSLIAAVGSFLEARSRGGEWLVRIEDIDGPRAVPGAADDILRDLDRYGLHWDGIPTWQSARTELYREALTRLRDAGWTFPCGCSRRDYVGVYPGTCRERLRPGRRARTRRLRVDDATVVVHDEVQGEFRQNLASAVGDFVLRRADGIFAYHLAVVVDDAEQGITHVVRGADLLDSTPRQMRLQHCAGLTTPAYAHLPVAVNAAGQKLSKQTYAEPLAGKPPVAMLLDALDFLGQEPDPALRDAELDEVWAWASASWRLAKVPRRRARFWPGDRRRVRAAPCGVKEKE